MNTGHNDDDKILEGFRQEQPEALHHVQGWIDGILHLGRWDFDDPEGVGQEILMKLVRIVRRDGFRQRSSFKTFVFSVAKHTCVDVYRRERLRAVFERVGQPGSTTGADPEKMLQERERVEMAHYILQKLPDECRRLWAWIYQEGLSAVEVGRRLEIKTGNVRVRVHRCLQKARSVGRHFLEHPQPDLD